MAINAKNVPLIENRCSAVRSIVYIILTEISSLHGMCSKLGSITNARVRNETHLFAVLIYF